MEAYLDNSATTRCCEEAAQLVVKLLTEDYGNPSSLHNKGVIAENYMNDARKKIAKTLKVQEKELCFTSGGTESNNLAIIGVAEANKRSGKHVITTSIEHPSVSATMAYLEEHGYEVTYLPVDAYGVISLDDLKAAIRPDTILVSLMQVNNEIGAVEPIAEAGALIKQCNPQTLFHVDAIQSYGKMRIYPAKMHVDLLSVSGHKIHGPKGSGFLYIKDKTKIHPLLNGGGQQRGMRSGTENVPAIAGLGVAAERIYTGFEEKIDRGEMLEYVNYCGKYYGTPKSEVDARLDRGTTVVLVIEVVGAANIKKLYPESTLIFIMPPSMDELRARLRGRGTESEEAIAGRLKRAEEELPYAREYDFSVENRDVDACADEIYRILKQRQQD